MFEQANGEKSDLKSFKDVKSIDDLDFDKIELKKGETPEDIQEKCLQICKDYLSGNWSEQTVDTIEVRRVTGGMVNQLYYCRIKEPNNSEDVPQEVAIRLYGESLFGAEDENRIRDVVIALTFSENNLGPKIYGLFEGGQIQKYYKHRQFFGEDQNNPELVRKLMKHLAQIHSLNVPLKKDGNLLWNLMDKIYKEAFEKYPINDFIEEFKCETLKTHDLRTEIDWIKGVVERSNSPVLFTHNDFRSSNVLITEPNDQLIACDFDLSGYSFRSYDFVSLMKEWGRKQFDLVSIEGMPLQDEFMPVIELYVEEFQRIHGKSFSENPINSVEHILKEAKIGLLFGILFFIGFFLNSDEKDLPMQNFRQVMMQFAEKNYENYFKIKDIFREQKIID